MRQVMDEKPKSIWTKSWKGPRGYLLWFILLTLAAFGLILCIGLASPERHAMTQLAAFSLVYALGFALAGILLIAFTHWLSCWRNFKRFLFGLACFVTLIALFYAEEDWRGKHDWGKFKREWEAKGERFDRASVVPPPVPEEQNFALTPIVFTSYGQLLTRDGKFIPWAKRDTNFVNRLQVSIGGSQPWPTNGDWRVARADDLSAWQQYYRALAAKTNLFPVPAQPQSPAADVLLALSKYSSTIEELREAGKLPYSRFPLEYDKDDPAAILLPHLAVMKGCAQVLQLRALAELQNGQSDQALADIKLMLRLADSVRTEPILISQLVRLAVVNLALQPVWEGLSQHQWSDTQLTEIENELAKIDFLAASELSLRAERVFDIGIIEWLRHLPLSQKIRDLSDLSGNGDDVRARDKIAFYLGPSGWIDQSELRISRFFIQYCLPMANVDLQTVSPTSARKADEALGLEMGPSGRGDFFERLLLPALGSAMRKFAFGQNAVNLARTACALGRYRLAHGEFSESLDSLTPQFIAKLPHDIINGQPLHYRCEAGGQFVLYSVGWNETGDGGEVGFNKFGTADISKGDWVWRYPQK